jgi:anionic cell wall polymer biosynthesis LytR-Cps2A-Psr (LCP) family protein
VNETPDGLFSFFSLFKSVAHRVRSNLVLRANKNLQLLLHTLCATQDCATRKRQFPVSTSSENEMKVFVSSPKSQLPAVVAQKFSLSFGNLPVENLLGNETKNQKQNKRGERSSPDNFFLTRRQGD